MAISQELIVIEKCYKCHFKAKNVTMILKSESASASEAYNHMSKNPILKTRFQICNCPNSKWSTFDIEEMLQA